MMCEDKFKTSAGVYAGDSGGATFIISNHEVNLYGILSGE